MTNYQAMCAAAKEIQEAWEHHNGDMYYAPVSGRKEYIFSKVGAHFRHMIWLPRIEDLIAILAGEELSDVGVLGNFVCWINEHLEMILGKPRTAPEIWLSFVMSELHNKTWNGSEWL